VTLLLIDLDDTLLGNPMDSFLPAYLKGLAERMASVTDPQKLVQSLLAATNHMVTDARPDQTLEEKFDSRFFPALGLRRPEVQFFIDTFYQEDFPRLAALTVTIPAAKNLVQQALARAYQVAVATNPLFPRTAIHQRLAWSGLPVDEVPFALVPSYETFHFAKPNPAYFAEFLAQLGWPEGPVVMVGDDPENDIDSARQLGLPVFWIANPLAAWPGSDAEPARGALHELLAWLDSKTPSALLPDFSSPRALKAILRSTPAALATLMTNRTPDEHSCRPTPGEWSPAEVLCHLRDVEREVNLPRLYKVLKNHNPFIAGQDTDRWANERQYINQDCINALHTFMEARIELLGQVDHLTDVDWDRPIRHAIFGPTQLGEMINIIAGHDRLHIRQIFQSLVPLS
jgi:FMN phosphatase YigB (HAD superfamily)